MSFIHYRNRTTKQVEKELIYGYRWISFCYGQSWIARLVGRLFLHLLIKNPIFSHLYGRIQRLNLTRRKIAPFIAKFQVRADEFALPVEAFTSFNDFFCRQLKAEARPIIPLANTAIIPADGRYLAFSHIHLADQFFVKGERFNLETFLQSKELACRYEDGSLMIARLNPSDCHRFLFPFDCQASTPQLINGQLFSVNPQAFPLSLRAFLQNKRVVTELTSELFGKVLYIEVGATCVGTVHQTFKEGFCKKGEEKGYFSFGGSSLVLLFEKGKIVFDEDILKATEEGMETYCKMGESLGISTH